MRQIPDQLKSRNLVPFRKRRGKYNIPGMSSGQDELTDRVDDDLSSEEQGFVRHYLGFADIFLKNAEESEPVSEEQVFSAGDDNAELLLLGKKDSSDQAA